MVHKEKDMDTNWFLVLANFLLVVVTYLLFRAAKLQAKIAEIEGKTRLLQFHLTVLAQQFGYTIPLKQIEGLIEDQEKEKVIVQSKSLYRQILDTDLRSVKSFKTFPPFLKAPRRLYTLLKWLCTGKWVESTDIS